MCDIIPIRTVLATTDDTLYNEDSQKWYWEDNGKLYVGIGCGENRPNNFQELTISPYSWSYCGSHGCSYLTDQILVYFTFKPNSNDDSDYLIYRIDIPSSKIVSRPVNKIKDPKGENLDLDIESASRHGAGSDAILELWMGRGSARGAFLPEFVNRNKFNVVKFAEFLGIGVIVTITVIFLIYLLRKNLQ